MNAMSDISVGANEEALILGPLIGEYAQRLAVINRDLVAALQAGFLGPGRTERAAWLLDSVEIIRKPLVQILSRASQLIEHAELSPVMHDMMVLRLADLEAQLHHATRLPHEYRQTVIKKGEAEVASLRMAAGLNGMKGGPLRPA